MSAITPNRNQETDPAILAFYRQVLQSLNAANLPFLVGGAYAFNHYAHINRLTKDLDLFIRRGDFERISEALLTFGYETELTHPHWLGKIHFQDTYIDLIFSSGNGVAIVDDAWFEHAGEAEVLGIPVRICPAEEIIWSKAYVMERERYDGADIVHLLHACGKQLDWPRLLGRFGPHWRILLSHLTLFGFIYPSYRDCIPVWVMDELIGKLRQECHAPPPQENICQGTLLSREQYLPDLEQQGLQDARVIPFGNMTSQDTAQWTAAIAEGHKNSS